MSSEKRSLLWCVVAGLCIAAAMPPWGWWPLAFVGIAVADRQLADQPTRNRFLRMWIIAASWLLPATLWMFDLTPPGYVVAQAMAALMFAVGAAATPPSGNARRVGLVGTVTLAELARWSWPFGGVPLATLPMSQVASPLAPTVRTLGSLLLVALVVVVGTSLSALIGREFKAAAVGGAVVLACIGWAAVAPRGHVVRRIDVALVQGGGQQRTRADAEQTPLVFARHVEATRTIDRPVDLVLWPENVVNPRAPYLSGTPRTAYLDADEAAATLSELAVSLNTTLIPGWFYAIDDETTVNFSEVITPDGKVTNRYDKVRTVPFGEFVPLRGFIESFGVESLPPRDARPGTEPAVLDTPFGRVGVAISWEIFFDHRARDAIGNGGQILLNPTNGSSYWLTMVQTQQIASSRLRALETGRWVLQAAPTGFSAVIDPDGNVRQRTAISEQAVLYDTVELRSGLTIANRVGAWPMLVLSFSIVLAAHGVARRRDQVGRPDAGVELA